ncbi:MAG: NosD domain-containing protein [Candidatus Pacearchaeota archaeon]
MKKGFFILAIILLLLVVRVDAATISVSLPVEPPENFVITPIEPIQKEPVIPVEPVELKVVENCSCYSCDECEEKLNNPACTEVILEQDIFDHVGRCIDNPENFNNKIFNCNYHFIIGNGYEGIYLENKHGNIIKNCKISNFSQAIFLLHVSDSLLEKNELNFNGVGVYSVYSDNNEIIENIANNNTYGFYLMSSSNNRIIKNEAKYNVYYGIFYDVFSQYNFLSSNLFENNRAGIYMQSWANYNILENNSIVSNVEEGIAIYSSDGNTLNSNYLAFNDKGIALYAAPHNILRENRIENNVINFHITGFEKVYYLQDIDTSNIVDGKPIYYYNGNCDNFIVPNNAGMLVLISCKNVTVKNLEIKNNSPGIILVEVNNSSIYDNIIKNNGEGILLFNSSKNSINNNYFISNIHGIFTTYSENNSIKENNFSSNLLSGIYLYSSSNNNIIERNYIEESKIGITGVISGFNKILNNSLNSIEVYGILLYASNENEIKENLLENNINGIFFIEGSSYNILENNQIIDNRENGISFMYNSNNNAVSKNFLESYKGILVSQSFNNFLNDCIILSENYSIEMDYPLSNISLVNVSFDKDNVQIYEGKLYVKWYLDVYVNDSQGNPQEGAIVTIKDMFNNEKILFTEQNGFIPRQIVDEYYQDSQGKHYVNFYRIVVDKSGFYSVVKDLSVKENELLIATLKRKNFVKKDIME